MDWIPISEDCFWDLLNDETADLSVAGSKFFEAIRIIPEKWNLEPWGREGNGFWVIGIAGKSVLWYNDIEDGFNVSKYTQYGTLDEYWCNQDGLSTAVEQFKNLVFDQVAIGRCGPPRQLDDI